MSIHLAGGGPNIVARASVSMTHVRLTMWIRFEVEEPAARVVVTLTE